MMVELWTRKREMEDEDENDVEDTRNQGYDLADWVGKTSYQRHDTPDRDSYLLCQGWYVDSHTKFSRSPYLMMIFLVSSRLFLSHHQLYHRLRTHCFVIPLYFCMR